MLANIVQVGDFLEGGQPHPASQDGAHMLDGAVSVPSEQVQVDALLESLGRVDKPASFILDAGSQQCNMPFEDAQLLVLIPHNLYRDGAVQDATEVDQAAC